jgi:hypothetical protein
MQGAEVLQPASILQACWYFFQAGLFPNEDYYNSVLQSAFLRSGHICLLYGYLSVKDWYGIQTFPVWRSSQISVTENVS